MDSGLMFESLAPELQLYILSFLDDDDFKRLKSVSKKWCQLARHPSLKKQVILNGVEQSSKEMISSLNNSFACREIEFYQISKWNFIANLPKCKLLRIATFYLCQLSSRTMSSLVQHFPLVEEVNISFIEFDYQVLCEIVRWKNLKNISINASFGLANDNSCVSLIFKSCPHVRNLCIMGENVRESLIEKAENLRKRAETLKQQFELLRPEFQELLRENDKIRKQRDKYVKKCDNLIKRETADPSTQKKSFLSYFGF